MKVYVLTRTENFGESRRIVEGVYKSPEKAEWERTMLLKRYGAPSKLCMDTEIDVCELEG